MNFMLLFSIYVPNEVGTTSLVQLIRVHTCFTSNKTQRGTNFYVGTKNRIFGCD